MEAPNPLEPPVTNARRGVAIQGLLPAEGT